MFTSIWKSRISSVISSNGAKRQTPALQQATLISPNFSTPLAAAASICARSATLATTVMISAPYFFLNLSAVSSTAGDKSTMISFAPYFAYVVEIPSPSPTAAPVINATFPSNLAILLFSFSKLNLYMQAIVCFAINF